MTFVRNFSTFLCLLILVCCQSPVTEPVGFPTVSRETKPWTRWWWQGSALTKEGITAEMEAYKKAGLGGLEITPIYGVLGYEDQFVEYLTPQWMELLIHTLEEAERLHLGIDMATGTGWPFGGPWVSDKDACKNLQYNTYDLKGGKRLKEKIEFIQQPFLRAVGNQIYEVHESFSTEKTIALGTRKEPLARVDPKQISISDLVQPVSANKNLQALALDQVIFERPLRLVTLVAYSEQGAIINLKEKVTSEGRLDWVAPEGTWKLYAIFEGSHGKMVERAGPGGEGNVIDHFSSDALKNYLSKFDSAFAGKDISSLRAFFNDSYEVDDARGAADWTPALFEEFKKRRGYNLEGHLPALFGKDDVERNERILCDYRETISELVLENFTTPWKQWAHDKSKIVRNQAHGSPSNILDLYAVVDIPEIEGVDPLRMKMASSAGNVTGKKLISSESATWLNEHFESNLADIKIAVDRFMLNGINHVFYHGTTYSPPGETWPGWLFYAAVHMNPRNSLWTDVLALNQYITRCQSFLQNSSADNDVLLYYPVYDRFSTPGEEMVEHFDGIGKQFENTAFSRSAETMLEKGYTFDYISDAQIINLKWDGEQLITQGGGSYKTIVLPHCRYIPAKTFQKIISLAEEGATVLVPGGLPSSVAGYGNLEDNKKLFDQLIVKCSSGAREAGERISESALGKGRLVFDDAFEFASLRREKMTDSGIKFTRRKRGDKSKVYLISNENDQPFEGWLPLSSSYKSIVLFDPMNGEFGKGDFRKTNDGAVEVYVQLIKKQTLILEGYNENVEVSAFKYYTSDGVPLPLSGKWKVAFQSGGPALPAELETDSLKSWTAFGENGYPSFSGTASYTLEFTRPVQNATGWILDLGSVRESASVILNGKSIGTLIGPVYQCYVDGSLLKENNVLEVRVSNLMANRISDMDKKGIFWKKFYNVNFPARKTENRKNGLFDASNWKPKDSGLIGPVRLLPVTLK